MSDDLYQMDFGWSVIDAERGFEIKHKPDLGEWAKSWADVNSVRQVSKWARGFHYMAAADGGLGEEVHQFVSPLQVTLGTVQNEASVCRAYLGYEKEFMDRVSFSHHEVVAKLPPARRRHWLQQCVDAELTVADLRELTAEERGVDEEGEPGHKKSPLEKLKNGRDVVEAARHELPEGPWVDLVDTAVGDLDDAIKTLQENLAPQAIGARPSEESEPEQRELAGVA